MASNAQLLSKADTTLSTLSTGGIQVNEQDGAFVRKLIKSPTILREARVIEMRSPTKEINKIQFGARILRPAAEATALSSSDRSAPTTEQVLLSAFAMKAEIRVSYETFEDAIERASLGQDQDGGAGTPLQGALRDTFVELIMGRASLDLEELALNGDTASADAYLAQNDGWLREVQTNGYTHDNAGVRISKELFKSGQQVLPDQYQSAVALMRHYVSVDQEIEYRNTLADRATGTGDNYVERMQNATPFGVPLMKVMTMPEDRGLFCDPRNLLMGIHRDVLMEFGKDITAGVYIIVLSMRVDFQVEEAEAAVAYEDVGEALAA